MTAAERARNRGKFIVLAPKGSSLPYRSVCSVHRSLKRAVAAAKRCTEEGGDKHVVLYAKTVWSQP